MSETQAGWTYVSAFFIALFVVTEVALRPWQPERTLGWRRREVMTWAMTFMAVCCVYLLSMLATSTFTSMPTQAQDTVASRARLLVFLFWLTTFAVLGLTGASAFAASFAVLGWVQRPDPHPHPVLPIRSAFAEEFWGIVAAREQLASRAQVVTWLRHALFGVALVLTSGVGLLMTFGLPKEALWPHLAAGVAAVLILNPARSDRRKAQRLAAVEHTGS